MRSLHQAWLHLRCHTAYHSPRAGGDAGFLHTVNWSEKKHVMMDLEKPTVELRETEYGLRRTRSVS